MLSMGTQKTCPLCGCYLTAHKGQWISVKDQEPPTDRSIEGKSSEFPGLSFLMVRYAGNGVWKDSGWPGERPLVPCDFWREMPGKGEAR